MPTPKKHTAKSFTNCSECGKRLTRMGLPTHWRKAHPDLPWPGMPDEYVDPRPAPREPPPPPPPATPSTNGNSSAPKKAAQPGRPAEFGAITTLQPRAFQMSSSLLWQAMHITINEWGWPPEIMNNPGEWLDIFLHRAMREFGWILGGYVRVNQDGSLSGPEAPTFSPPPPEEEEEDNDDDATLEAEEGAEYASADAR